MIILSGLGFYGYQHHHQAIARKQAELYLQDIALNLHEHQDSKNGYANLNLAQLGFSASKDDYDYQLNVSTTTFIIQAQPKFTDQCGTLSLDQSGQRGSTFEDCWN